MTTTRTLPGTLLRLLAVQSSLMIAGSMSAQVAPAPTPTPTPAGTAPAKTPAKVVPVAEIKGDAEAPPEEEAIVLSPFEVVTDTKGYYSANTMSGTRFNSKLEDLASSISVMTKEQMSDFGMLDINDVFLYMGNAEGTGTYTDFVVDRNGQAFDNVQLNPTGANRIRGVSSANISYGNFEVSGRMPIDPLIIEGIEVSRGPNANVFGIGNAGGTLNQVPSSANLTRNKTRIDLRVDSYEGWRTSFDANHVLKKNYLAFRVSGAYQRDEFQRKPSGMNTRRLNAMVKFQPFKYTTISAAAIDYRTHGNRPNFTPPRDNVTYWRSRGSPSWNPSNSTYTLNGVTYGLVSGTVQALTAAPVAANAITNDNLVPDFFFRPNYMFQRSNVYIDQGGVGYWTSPVSTQGTTPLTNTGSLRLQMSSPGFGIVGNNSGGRIGNQPLFSTVPVVSDQSIYDWSEHNLSAVNRLRDSTKMYIGQIDQVILNTPKQSLVIQLAAMRENNERYARTPIGNSGNSGVSGQLFVDVNSHNLDGTPNAYYGRTFVGVSEPRTVYSPSTWDTYRGQASYRLDLSQEENALKWLGTHQVSSYYEYKYRLNRQEVYRDVLTSNHPWTATIPANQARANQSNNQIAPGATASTIIAGPGAVRSFTRYYVGDASGNNVDYGPSEYAYGTYNFRYGTTGAFTTDAATLGRFATTDGTGGTANLKQILKSYGLVAQSQFLGGKVILTGGLREDQVFSKFGAVPQLLVNNNSEHDFEANNHWAGGDYRANSGKTKTYGAVVRPFRDLPFVTKSADSAGAQRHLGQLVRGLAFTYNVSDTFFPQGPAIDLQLKPLPNITGEGKDYGLWINMLDNKLVVRVNRYETKQLNARNGDANTIAQRVLRMDLNIRNVGDVYQLYDVVNKWTRLANPTWTDAQVEAEITRVTKLDPVRSNALIDGFANGTIAATNDVVAKGTEIEVNYNPTKFWTIAASAEEKTSKNANISSSVQEWLDERLPVLQSIIDPRYGTPWWTTPYNNQQDFVANGSTAAANYEGFVRAPYAIIKQQEGKSLPSIRRYSGRFSTSFQLAGLTDQRILKSMRVGGAVRYESKGAIGYRGIKDAAGIYQTLDGNQPVYDKEHYYVDAFVGYRTKLWNNKINAEFRLNCRNIAEDGRLQPIGVFPDGVPHSYRIVDPRIFLLTATFDL